MNILVMAAGAVGGYFGSVMAQKNDVFFIARGEHLERIQKDGLRVHSATSGDLSVRTDASSHPPDGYVADLVLFCVKAYHNAAACDAIEPAMGEDTLVLSLQNGLGSGDILASRFGSKRVLLGAAYVDASRSGPGFIEEYGGTCRIIFGESLGISSIKTQEISRSLSDCGIKNRVSKNIMTELWKKLVFISALSGMTCLARAPFHELFDNEQTRNLVKVVMEETFDVATSSGVILHKDLVSHTMNEFQRHKGDLVSSMYQDLIAGRPLEVEVINGAVSRIGKETGVPVPVNDTIRSCLSLIKNGKG